MARGCPGRQAGATNRRVLVPRAAPRNATIAGRKRDAGFVRLSSQLAGAVPRSRWRARQRPYGVPRRPAFFSVGGAGQGAAPAGDGDAGAVGAGVGAGAEAGADDRGSRRGVGDRAGARERSDSVSQPGSGVDGRSAKVAGALSSVAFLRTTVAEMRTDSRISAGNLLPHRCMDCNNVGTRRALRACDRPPGAPRVASSLPVRARACGPRCRLAAHHPARPGSMRTTATPRSWAERGFPVRSVRWAVRYLRVERECHTR